MAKNFENLDCWNCAIELATKIYELTSDFPKEELYGLTSQLRRASISVSANISEGAGRGSVKSYIHFINTALGSLNEVESLTHVAYKLHYLNDESKNQVLLLTEKCGNYTGGLKRHLSQKL